MISYFNDKGVFDTISTLLRKSCKQVKVRESYMMKTHTKLNSINVLTVLLGEPRGDFSGIPRCCCFTSPEVSTCYVIPHSSGSHRQVYLYRH